MFLELEDPGVLDLIQGDPYDELEDMMEPCRHLDFDGDYTDCEIVELPGFSCRVRHWKRGDRWTKPAFEGAEPGPKNVQFCGQGRGRINGIFQCYNEGEMSCYDPEAEGDQP